MVRQIIPGILATDEIQTHDLCHKLFGATTWLHLDILDKTLYPYSNWHELAIIKQWQLPFHIELHLMVNDPLSIVESWQAAKLVQRALWHIEAPIDHQFLIKFAHRHNVEAGLAIAPATDLSKLEPFINDIDRVVILGVEPGRSGQTMLPDTYQRIVELKRTHPELIVAVDGGVNEINLAPLITAGANDFCVASAIFSDHDPVARLRQLRAILQTYDN